jgi:hypothetical protein
MLRGRRNGAPCNSSTGMLAPNRRLPLTAVNRSGMRESVPHGGIS